jgi:hypothetical protein
MKHEIDVASELRMKPRAGFGLGYSPGGAKAARLRYQGLLRGGKESTNAASEPDM